MSVERDLDSSVAVWPNSSVTATLSLMVVQALRTGLQFPGSPRFAKKTISVRGGE